MYKSLIILTIFALFSCHKQTQNANEGNETDIASIMNNENTSQENIKSNENILEEGIIRPDFVSISNEDNFPLEYIIGAWWSSNPYSNFFIEFTNDGIFYIRQLFRYEDLLVEDFFPYKIEENNIIIENINKSNNVDEDIKKFFLSPGAYIISLDDRSLRFEKWMGSYKNSFLCYRGTMEEVLEISRIRLVYENKLKKYIANEVLNEVIFQGDENDINGVIDTYGVPIRDEIVEYSGTPRYFREITYEDLTHRYYVLNNNKQRYADVIIDKKLARLTTMNIGVASDEVTAVFGSNYWRKEGEDIIYMWGGDGIPGPLRWVRFSIENGIVVKITYIISDWGK